MLTIVCFLCQNEYIYTEPKKKLSPSLNVDLFVQFWILFETRFLRWINVLGFYMVISWTILQTIRVLQATSCLYVCTSKWYHSTTGSYFAKVSFLVQYIYLSTEIHVCYNSLANGYVVYSLRIIKMLIVTFFVTFAVLLFKNTVNSTVSGYGQFKVTFRNTYLFFPEW